MRNPLVLGERIGEERPFDDRIFVLAGAVGCIGVGQVRNAQQQVAEFGLDHLQLVGSGLLLVAQRSALRLQRLGACGIAFTTLQANLLRQFVDLRSHSVAA